METSEGDFVDDVTICNSVPAAIRDGVGGTSTARSVHPRLHLSCICDVTSLGAQRPFEASSRPWDELRTRGVSFIFFFFVSVTRFFVRELCPRGNTQEKAARMVFRCFRACPADSGHLLRMSRILRSDSLRAQTNNCHARKCVRNRTRQRRMIAIAKNKQTPLFREHAAPACCIFRRCVFTMPVWKHVCTRMAAASSHPVTPSPRCHKSVADLPNKPTRVTQEGFSESLRSPERLQLGKQHCVARHGVTRVTPWRASGNRVEWSSNSMDNCAVSHAYDAYIS